MDAYERLNAINEGIQRLRRIQRSLAKTEQGIADRVQNKVDKIVKSGGLDREGGVQVTRDDMVARQIYKERKGPRLQGLRSALATARDKLVRRDKKLKPDLTKERALNLGIKMNPVRKEMI